MELSRYEYKALRQKLGTQLGVAKILGISGQTIYNRESGRVRIGPEACFAIIGAVMTLADKEGREWIVGKLGKTREEVGARAR